MNYYIGIDISKDKHDVAIMNADKKLLGKTFVIKEEMNGYQYFLSRINQLRQSAGGNKIMIGMEATGDYWKNLYHFIRTRAEDCSVVVINPIQTRAFAKTQLRRAKTDPVNARDIAQFLVEKNPKPYVSRAALLDSIKDVDRQMYSLKKQKTMTMNRFRIELSKTAPEIEHAVSYLDGQQILALLNLYPTAEQIAKASLQKLRRIRYGRPPRRISASLIEKVKSISENSIAHKNGLGSGYVVQSLTRPILHIDQEIERLQKQLLELYEHIKKEDSLLSQISGVSKESAAVLEAYTGDVQRFPNAKAFVAYFGMNPTVNQSGKSIKRQSYLQKKGSGGVRHKLYMIVLNMIRRCQEPIYSYYTRLVEKGKPKMVAVGAAMRKLLVIMYAVLKHQTKFNPNYQQK